MRDERRFLALFAFILQPSAFIPAFLFRCRLTGRPRDFESRYLRSNRSVGANLFRDHPSGRMRLSESRHKRSNRFLGAKFSDGRMMALVAISRTRASLLVSVPVA
jgi:hypothetical protein